MTSTKTAWLFADDPFFRNILSDTMSDAGFLVDAAGISTDRLESRQYPAVIVIDWEKPEAKARQLLFALQQRHARVPLIVLSGSVTRADSIPGTRALFIRKPFDIGTFLNALSPHLP